MPTQILLNLLIAFIWMFFHETWDVLTFAVGYTIGLFIIFSLRRFFPDPFYPKKMLAIVKLLIIFIRELIKSTLVVIRQVTRPTINVKPGIFRIKTQLETNWEITILSCLVTLTPGSVVLEVAGEERVLFIHAMDIPEGEEMVLDSIAIFERAIMEVTR